MAVPLVLDDIYYKSDDLVMTEWPPFKLISNYCPMKLYFGMRCVCNGD